MAILIVIPAGIAANQKATQNETNGLTDTINQTSAATNQTATEIQCGLAIRFRLGSTFSGVTSGVPVAVVVR